MFPEHSLILIVTALVISALGFYRFVWFMSVGYGLAVAGMGIVMLIIGRPDLCAALLCLSMIVYGVRLGGFLLVREIKNAAYKKTLDAQVSKPVPIFVKAVMWIFLALLYFCQVSPVWYRISAGRAGDVFAWAGLVIACAGIALEALADQQKSAAKKKNPGKPAMDGLYRYSRCPNYFGEMTFWTGIFVSGLPVLQGLQWIPALIGYICILCIMVSGAQRLERRQTKNYGSDPDYRAYAEKTPILVPFIPVYSLEKKKK